MIYAYLGKATWPIAVILVVLIAAVTTYYLKDQSDKNSLKKEIVQTCASKPDLPKCVDDVTKAVNAVN